MSDKYYNLVLHFDTLNEASDARHKLNAMHDLDFFDGDEPKYPDLEWREDERIYFVATSLNNRQQALNLFAELDNEYQRVSLHANPKEFVELRTLHD